MLAYLQGRHPSLLPSPHHSLPSGPHCASPVRDTLFTLLVTADFNLPYDAGSYLAAASASNASASTAAVVASAYGSVLSRSGGSSSVVAAGGLTSLAAVQRIQLSADPGQTIRGSWAVSICICTGSACAGTDRLAACLDGTTSARSGTGSESGDDCSCPPGFAHRTSRRLPPAAEPDAVADALNTDLRLGAIAAGAMLSDRASGGSSNEDEAPGDALGTNGGAFSDSSALLRPARYGALASASLPTGVMVTRDQQLSSGGYGYNVSFTGIAGVMPPLRVHSFLTGRGAVVSNRVVFSGVKQVGSFSLKWRGGQSAPIPAGASAQQVRQALLTSFRPLGLLNATVSAVSASSAGDVCRWMTSSEGTRQGSAGFSLASSSASAAASGYPYSASYSSGSASGAAGLDDACAGLQLARSGTAYSVTLTALLKPLAAFTTATNTETQQFNGASGWAQKWADTLASGPSGNASFFTANSSSGSSSGSSISPSSLAQQSLWPWPPFVGPSAAYGDLLSVSSCAVNSACNQGLPSLVDTAMTAALSDPIFGGQPPTLVRILPGHDASLASSSSGSSSLPSHPFSTLQLWRYFASLPGTPIQSTGAAAGADGVACVGMSPQHLEAAAALAAVSVSAGVATAVACNATALGTAAAVYPPPLWSFVTCRSVGGDSTSSVAGGHEATQQRKAAKLPWDLRGGASGAIGARSIQELLARTSPSYLFGQAIIGNTSSSSRSWYTAFGPRAPAASQLATAMLLASSTNTTISTANAAALLSAINASHWISTGWTDPLSSYAADAVAAPSQLELLFSLFASSSTSAIASHSAALATAAASAQLAALRQSCGYSADWDTVATSFSVNGTWYGGLNFSGPLSYSTSSNVPFTGLSGYPPTLAIYLTWHAALARVRLRLQNDTASSSSSSGLRRLSPQRPWRMAHSLGLIPPAFISSPAGASTDAYSQSLSLLFKGLYNASYFDPSQPPSSDSFLPCCYGGAGGGALALLSGGDVTVGLHGLLSVDGQAGGDSNGASVSGTSAGSGGDGGTVVISAGGVTAVSGRISARGGRGGSTTSSSSSASNSSTASDPAISVGGSGGSGGNIALYGHALSIDDQQSSYSNSGGRNWAKQTLDVRAGRGVAGSSGSKAADGTVITAGAAPPSRTDYAIVATSASLAFRGLLPVPGRAMIGNATNCTAVLSPPSGGSGSASSAAFSDISCCASFGPCGALDSVASSHAHGSRAALRVRSPPLQLSGSTSTAASAASSGDTVAAASTGMAVGASRYVGPSLVLPLRRDQAPGSLLYPADVHPGAFGAEAGHAAGVIASSRGGGGGPASVAGALASSLLRLQAVWAAGQALSNSSSLVNSSATANADAAAVLFAAAAYNATVLPAALAHPLLQSALWSPSCLASSSSSAGASNSGASAFASGSSTGAVPSVAGCPDLSSIVPRPDRITLMLRVEPPRPSATTRQSSSASAGSGENGGGGSEEGEGDDSWWEVNGDASPDLHSSPHYAASNGQPSSASSWSSGSSIPSSLWGAHIALHDDSALPQWQAWAAGSVAWPPPMLIPLLPVTVAQIQVMNSSELLGLLATVFNLTSNSSSMVPATLASNASVGLLQLRPGPLPARTPLDLALGSDVDGDASSSPASRSSASAEALASSHLCRLFTGASSQALAAASALAALFGTTAVNLGADCNVTISRNGTSNSGGTAIRNLAWLAQALSPSSAGFAYSLGLGPSSSTAPRSAAASFNGPSLTAALSGPHPADYITTGLPQPASDALQRWYALVDAVRQRLHGNSSIASSSTGQASYYAAASPDDVFIGVSLTGGHESVASSGAGSGAGAGGRRPSTDLGASSYAWRHGSGYGGGALPPWRVPANRLPSTPLDPSQQGGRQLAQVLAARAGLDGDGECPAASGLFSSSSSAFPGGGSSSSNRIGTRWHKVDIFLDWSSRTYRVRINDVTVIVGAPMTAGAAASPFATNSTATTNNSNSSSSSNRSSHINRWLGGVTRIGLYALGGATVYYDEIFAGKDDTLGFECPSSLSPGHDLRMPPSSIRPGQHGWEAVDSGPQSGPWAITRHDSHVSRREAYVHPNHSGLLQGDGVAQTAYSSDIGGEATRSTVGPAGIGLSGSGVQPTGANGSTPDLLLPPPSNLSAYGGFAVGGALRSSGGYTDPSSLALATANARRALSTALGGSSSSITGLACGSGGSVQAPVRRGGVSAGSLMYQPQEQRSYWYGEHDSSRFGLQITPACAANTANGSACDPASSLADRDRAYYNRWYLRGGVGGCSAVSTGQADGSALRLWRNEGLLLRYANLSLPVTMSRLLRPDAFSSDRADDIAVRLLSSGQAILQLTSAGSISSSSSAGGIAAGLLARGSISSNASSPVPFDPLIPPPFPLDSLRLERPKGLWNAAAAAQAQVCEAAAWGMLTGYNNSSGNTTTNAVPAFCGGGLSNSTHNTTNAPQPLVMWAYLDSPDQGYKAAGIVAGASARGLLAFQRALRPSGNATVDLSVLQVPTPALSSAAVYASYGANNGSSASSGGGGGGVNVSIPSPAHAFMVRSYFASTRYLMPSAVMQPLWESVKQGPTTPAALALGPPGFNLTAINCTNFTIDSNGTTWATVGVVYQPLHPNVTCSADGSAAVMKDYWYPPTDFALNYQRAYYDARYDDPDDTLRQRWRREDRAWNISAGDWREGWDERTQLLTLTNNATGEAKTYSASERGAVLASTLDRHAYKHVYGLGRPAITSRYLDPLDPANSAWSPSSVPAVKAQPWADNYADKNIADNAPHPTVADLLIGVDRVVQVRRASYVAITRLSDDYLSLKGEAVVDDAACLAQAQSAASANGGVLNVSSACAYLSSLSGAEEVAVVEGSLESLYDDGFGDDDVSCDGDDVIGNSAPMRACGTAGSRTGGPGWLIDLVQGYVDSDTGSSGSSPSSSANDEDGAGVNSSNSANISLHGSSNGDGLLFGWQSSASDAGASTYRRDVTALPFGFGTEADWQDRHWQYISSPGDRRLDFRNFRDRQVPGPEGAECPNIHHLALMKYAECQAILDGPPRAGPPARVAWADGPTQLDASLPTPQPRAFSRGVDTTAFEACISQHEALLADYEACVHCAIPQFDPPPSPSSSSSNSNSNSGTGAGVGTVLSEWGVGSRECVGGGGPCGPTEADLRASRGLAAVPPPASSAAAAAISQGSGLPAGTHSEYNASNPYPGAVTVASGGFPPFARSTADIAGVLCFAANGTAVPCGSTAAMGGTDLVRTPSARDLVGEDRAEKGWPPG